MPLVEKTCPVCNSKFSRPRWQAKKQTYCSVHCAKVEQHKDQHLLKQCERCHITFDTIPSRHRRFCSSYCANKMLNKHPHGRTKLPRVTKVCPLCNTKFEILACIANKRVHCSKKCLALSTTHHIYSPCPTCGKTVKSIKSNKRIYCSITCFRQANIDYSKTQKFVLDKILKLSGSTKYEFEYHSDWLKSAKGWSLYIDLMLHDLNLAIEYNGTYHYKSSKFLDKDHDGLAKRQERDQLKYRLVKEHGIKLLVWRYDEPNTKSHITKRIIQALT